jgi:hypothetical protein
MRISSPNVIEMIKLKKIRGAGQVTHVGETRKPEGRSRHQWEDDVKMNVVGICEDGNEPAGSIRDGNFLTS